MLQLFQRGNIIKSLCGSYATIKLCGSYATNKFCRRVYDFGLALSALFVVILQFIMGQVVQYEWHNQKWVSVISGTEMPGSLILV